MPATPGRSSWIGLLLILCATVDTHAAVRIKARLLTPVSSYRSKPGDGVEALVVPPACEQPLHAFPAGTVVTGHVRSIRKVGLGLIHETARMQLDFSDMRFPDGSEYAIESRLTGIDNARERVDRKGAIHGIRSTDSVASRIGSRLAIEAFEHPLLLGPALVLESSVFRFPDPEIEYGRGAELSLDLSLPDSVAAPECAAVGGDDPGASAIATNQFSAALPLWSYSKRQPQPMDLINLVFVGSQIEIERAFTAAGWNGARANSMRTGLKAVRAIAEGRSYPQAPMRTLLLDGDEPDLSFQTSLNTFEKRDHLRIWEQHEEWGDRPVWASAATRDVAATFSMGHPFGFTHAIQNNVDLEREKVVSDLQLTGCVDSVEYVKRPQSLHPEKRKDVYTDSRVAVIALNSCTAPAEDFSQGSSPMPPWIGVRVVRRITLTTRNHFMRDNIVWRSGDATRIGVQAVRRWYARRSERRLAAALYRTSVQ